MNEWKDREEARLQARADQESEALRDLLRGVLRRDYQECSDLETTVINAAAERVLRSDNYSELGLNEAKGALVGALHQICKEMQMARRVE